MQLGCLLTIIGALSGSSATKSEAGVPETGIAGRSSMDDSVNNPRFVMRIERDLTKPSDPISVDGLVTGNASSHLNVADRRDDSAWLVNGGRNNYFYATLSVGGSSAQKVAFDTGSSDTWFIGSSCTADDEKGCKPGQPGTVAVDSSMTSTGVTGSVRYGSKGSGVDFGIYITDVRQGSATSRSLPIGIATRLVNGMAGVGVLGMGFNSLSQIAGSLDNAQGGSHNANFLDHLGCNSFGVYLNPSVQDVGEVSFCFYDTSKFPPGATIQWFPISAFANGLRGGYWQFNPQMTFTYNGQSFDYARDQASTATGRVISDSGALGLRLTNNAANAINKFINPSYNPSDRVVPCTGNPLTLKMTSSSDANNGENPSTISYAIPYQVLVQQTGSNCISLITGGAETMTFTMLGAPFFQAVYTAHDKTNQRIGFVPLFSPPDAPVVVGCFRDTPQRAIAQKEWQRSDATQSRCLSDCTGAGFVYAGLENGNECYCSNALPRTQVLSATSCNYACAGDASVNCGGSWALTVVASSSATTQKVPVHLGCFRDTANRAMQWSTWVRSNAVTGTCLSDCTSAGFMYAGLQNGNACFCSNIMPDTVLPAGLCNMPCTGDNSGRCGGVWALSVITNASPVQPVNMGCYQDAQVRVMPRFHSTRHDMTATGCLSSCATSGYYYAGLENGVECYCSNTLPGIPSASCNVPCSGDSGQTCGGPWALSVFSSAFYAPLNVPISVGCYQDSTNRVMSRRLWVQAEATPTRCLRDCVAAGYAFAATENGNECWCDNWLPAASSDSCNMPCAGDSMQMCGGPWALSVVSRAVNLGCFQDNPGRVMPRFAGIYGDLSTSNCLWNCMHSGYTFAGVENGNECYCSNSLPSSPLPASSCSVPCTGDVGQKCGGSYALTVVSSTMNLGCYQDSSKRVLPSFAWKRDDATPWSCLATCVSDGLAYAGMENGNECWCGFTLPTSQVLPSVCGTRCSGDTSETCGGPWAVSVMSNSATIR
ncbi:aspartic peptidase domain-containing protein [Chytriomyces sp. MP71]|nr:aspartic peptidase domain-containing protein [Chytriomyces sp. MP71]